MILLYYFIKKNEINFQHKCSSIQHDKMIDDKPSINSTLIR